MSPIRPIRADRTGVWPAEKCERPGWRSGRGPHAARGSSTWDEPSTIGRPAGVSLSLDLTSPVVPGGSAGDAALSARWPVTRLRSRHDTFHVVPDKSETPIRLREDRELDEPVGVAPRGLGPATPYDRPANRPAVRRGGWWHSSRAPVPLTPREPGPFSAEIARRRLQQTRIPSPGWRCAFRYTGYLRERITPGQELIMNSQGSPQRFVVTPRKGAFIHRSYTGICTTSAVRAVPPVPLSHPVHAPLTSREQAIRTIRPCRRECVWSSGHRRISPPPRSDFRRGGGRRVRLPV